MLDTAAVEQLISGGESLTVEFKGESQRMLSDREIYETVVCFANTEGGVLLIGVENDGRVTGARPRHDGGIDPSRLQVAIFNNTAPSINTRISVHQIRGQPVLVIEVDRYPEICATKEGKCLRRVMSANGPECPPFYPYEHGSRRAALGLSDISARPVEETSLADLDPLEIERLRQTIEARNGDRVLLSLDDRSLVQALRLVESRGEVLVPNIAGLLLLGREDALRRRIPTNAVAFQVLDARGDVTVNDWFYGPMLKTSEGIEQRFAARNQEQEVQIGLLRLPVPDYAPDAFREAVANAILHRDYSQLGSIHVQFHPDHLMITNPGGFVHGITLDNILVHEPKPRNPRLAEAFRRIGMVETTGRGVDKIYLGQLRYGRPLPDYTLTDQSAVRLIVRGGPASLAFAGFVFEQDRSGSPLRLDDLLILNHLQHERRIDVGTASRLMQRSESHARSVLERLVERGLVEAKGERRGRVYHLSASLYRRLGSSEGYVRTRGFDAIRRQAMIMQYVESYGAITRGQVMDLCQATGPQATKLLQRLVAAGKLVRRGTPPRWTHYELADRH